MPPVMHTTLRANWWLSVGATLLIGAGVTTLASDFLTEGVDNARTGWVRDEKIFTPIERAADDAAVEGEAREHPAGDA